MGLYEVSLSMSLLGLGIGTMLANFHMCGGTLLLGAVLNMLVRNASPLRCMMLSLSGTCELLFLLCCEMLSPCLTHILHGRSQNILT